MYNTYNLEVLVNNTGAISFYKKKKFVITDTKVDKKDGSKFHVMEYNRIPLKISNNEKNIIKRQSFKNKIHRLHSF